MWYRPKGAIDTMPSRIDLVSCEVIYVTRLVAGVHAQTLRQGVDLTQDYLNSLRRRVDAQLITGVYVFLFTA